MVGCLIINDELENRRKKNDIIERLFLPIAIKEHRISQENWTIICIHHVEKQLVWQAVFNLEMENIAVGYGFGKKEEEAKQNAQKRLNVILKEQHLGKA